MAEKISLDEFAAAITEQLTQIAEKTDSVLEDVLSSRSREFADKVAKKSPKLTGAYSAGWRVRKGTRNHETVYIIYNAEKPYLTYILEYGNRHQAAQPHIRGPLAEVLDEILADLQHEL